MVTLKSKREYQLMKESAKILAWVLDEMINMADVGLSTADLNRKAEEMIESKGVKPAFKGYHGFPGTLCTSVNEQVVHGIPTDTPLQSGDIVSVDCGVILEGYYSDAARTIPIGEISDEAKRLIDVTRESFYKGIENVKVGDRIGDISHAVQTHVESNGYGVVRDFVGHGIGANLHEDPQVPNYGKPGTGIKIEKGLALAIEPMVTEGSPKVKVLDDDWTVVTADGKLAAHYEQTIFFGEDGRPEILTKN